MTKRFVITMVLLLTGAVIVKAQTQDDAQYTKVITERANKIVINVGVTDSVKFKKVSAIVANQYRSLGTVHDARNAQVKQIKAEVTDKTAANAQIAAIDSGVDKQLASLHKDYLAKLGKELTPAQVDKVKDEMTYKVLHVTYNGYLDELPQLTEAQKAQIMTWLVEAREKAIDAESSNKKHEVFGKYKGRINNYLSKQGYDMKKAGEEWQKRIKEREANKQQQPAAGK